MPSQLESAMDALMTVFYNYSGHDGDKYKLNKGELKELLNSELTDFLTVRLMFKCNDYFVVCFVCSAFRQRFDVMQNFQQEAQSLYGFKLMGTCWCTEVWLCIWLTEL